MKNQEIGRIGEKIAMEYLINNGYQILDKNFRTKFGEIDLIARAKDGTLVLVEVKAILVTGFEVLKPEDNFTPYKWRIVNRMCQFFVADHPELIDEDRGWQIDLIAIEISLNRKFIIRHYENI